MAPVSTVLRTCGLLLYFVLNIVAFVKDNQEPWILKLEVLTKDCAKNSCKYLLNVHGGEFLGHNSWRLTSENGVSGGDCDEIYPNYEIREILTLQWATKIEVIVPEDSGKIYFCLRFSEREGSPFGSKWSHQGDKILLDPKHDKVTTIEQKTLTTTERQTESLEETEWVDLSHDIDINYLPSIKRPTRKNIGDVEIFDDMVNIVEGIVDNDSNFINGQKWGAVYNEKDDIDKDGSENIEQNNFRKVNKNDDNITNKDANNYYDLDDLSRKFNGVDAEWREEIVKINNRGRNTATKDQAEVANNEAFKMILNEVDNTNRQDTDESLHAIKKRHRREILNIIEDDNKNNSYSSNFLSKNDKFSTFVDNNTRSKLSGEFDKDKTNFNKESAYSKIITIETDSNGINNMTNEESKPMIGKTAKYLISEEKTSVPKGKENIARFKRSTHLFQNDYTKDDFPRNHQTTVPVHSDLTTVKAIALDKDAPIPINIDGIRIEDSDKEPKIIGDGIPSVLADSRVTLRLFGDGLTSRTVIAFTNYPPLLGRPGEPCKFLLKGEYMMIPDSLTGKTALFDIIAPPTEPGTKIYLCVKNLRPDADLAKDEDKYIHQGSEPYKVFATHHKLLPLWVTLTLILICLTFSALFSGLNLGLMSLDRTELKIISNTGTEQERKYARAIMPVRDHGNYLLCSILLGNVAVNSTFTILLDELTSGLFAVIFSTLAIVLLGEITPQAICSRHGLMVGAKSIMVTKAVMALTAPLAFPVSKLLDYFLGEEIGSVYNRERLKELVKVTTDVNDLDNDEVNIISGALELRKKTVSHVMTKLEDVFMLPISSVLDFETMSEIIKSGYSRIPVYEGSRGNIVTVLFIKDLAFVDPDDNTPLRTLCQYYQNVCNFVFEDVTLDIMFKQFKDGHKGHMAFVHRINNEGEGDPFYETIGLVTLEDVIEEMIQAEIVDETDVFMDNRTKRRRNRPQHKLQDFAAFAEKHENQHIHISPQLTLATFQFLSTSVDAFRPDTVSETVLRRLLKQDVFHYIKLKGKTKKDPCTYVFQQGKPVDYFVLILEGRVEVTVGRENLVFEAGPFTYFGVQALTQNIGVAESPTPSAMGSLQNINMDSMLRHTFVPDYSVRAVTELYYLTVKRSLYLAAKRATLMEKGALSKGGTNEQFDTEVDKLLQSVDEDISISGEHKTPSRQVSPNPVPVSASPITRASFTSRASPEPRNGDLYAGARADEQEKLLK